MRYLRDEALAREMKLELRYLGDVADEWAQSEAGRAWLASR